MNADRNRNQVLSASIGVHRRLDWFLSRRIFAFILLLASAITAQQPSRDYPVKPVPFTAVHLTDAFWAPRIEINRTVTIPFAFQKDVDTGRFYNFERAAKQLRGEQFDDRKAPPYPFDDTDVYKVIEGAAYTLSVHPDPEMEARLDKYIATIAAAQEPDGYLYTARTMKPEPPHPWVGPTRWVNESIDSHELYNLGHLYEAAVAHYQATGKRSLLDIAIKTADLLDRTFGPGKESIWPGHQITEMGLAKMYRVTGDERYLKLAKFMLDVRGTNAKRKDNSYNQAHMPVVEQTEALGHAVRATYMYSGMADVAALTGDTAYVSAISKIWDNVASAKLYITGGIGARASGEAFGANYELPNMTAYNETCAAIGNDFWNHRLFLLDPDAKYIDVMERTLYNGLISGVSLDGKSFFYPNPLESNGQHARSPWFGVACCPSNITRFMASVPGYLYAERGDAVWVNLYAASNAEIKLDNGRVIAIRQQTKYPWDGAVHMTVTPDKTSAATIHVRIPGWAHEQVLSTDLYRFADAAAPRATVKVNGAPITMKLDRGYVTITRTWKAGDTIDLDLPMPVRRIVANEQVEADRGRVALQRGPIVYAAEWADNPAGRVRNLVLPTTSKLTAEFKPELLNGVEVVKSRAVAYSTAADGKVTHAEQEFTAIPYYAWANRGRGQMTVWLAASESAVTPAPYPTLAMSAKVRASHAEKWTGAINDGVDPPASNARGSYFDWWPRQGGTEWVEYAFPTASTISESELYWFDDTGRGGVRVPASWRLMYKDGDTWKPVEATLAYGVEKDRWNRVTFKSVTTTALRLEVTVQEKWSAGIQEWKVK